MEIELNVKKNEVLEEVAKTSAYSGSKMTEDEGAYERISQPMPTEKCLNASGVRVKWQCARP